MSRKTRRRLLRLLSRFPGVYAVIAFIFARRATVRGWSMAPGLLPGQRVLFDRLAYVRGRPRKGDVVLVAYPQEPGLRLVKRVAAVPKDTISGLTLGRREYWVLGDNEDASTDSRAFGPVRRENLLARAWIAYWPADRWRVF